MKIDPALRPFQSCATIRSILEGSSVYINDEENMTYLAGDQIWEWFSDPPNSVIR